jgi:hypothetical protein
MSASSIHYLVVHYEKENIFTVVADPSNKLKNHKRAQCQINDDWRTGNIVNRETKKACDGYASVKLASVDFEYTDSAANIPPEGTQNTKSN